MGVAEASAAAGWPVVVRDSGGTAFPIGPMTVQISVVRALIAERPPSVGALYRNLCEPIMAMLLVHGVRTTLESVEGSMCDGAYNLCVGGRKIAGTAQRQRRLPGDRVAVLAHAALSIGGAARPLVAAVEAYYAALGRRESFLDGRHTSLMECLPGPVTGTLESWSDLAVSGLAQAYRRSQDRKDPLRSSRMNMRRSTLRYSAASAADAVKFCDGS